MKRYWVYEKYLYENVKGPGQAYPVTTVVKHADVAAVVKSIGLYVKWYHEKGCAAVVMVTQHNNSLCDCGLLEAQRLLRELEGQG